MQYKAKTIQLSAARGGLYEGMLFRWDELDAHNDRFISAADIIVHGEPPVYVDHDYTQPPVGKIVQLSNREDGMHVYVKLAGGVDEKSFLSVGGFAYNWKANESGGLDIERFVVLEASLTATPAQKNTPLLQLKNQISMGYVAKQEVEQLAARIEELATAIAQLTAKQEEQATRLARVEEQIAALAQANVQVEEKTKSLLDAALKGFNAQNGELAEVMAKTIQTVSEILKKQQKYARGN